MPLIYCKKCILPNSRPNLDIDKDGNCNCSFSNFSKEINWEARRNDFVALVKQIKSLECDYDCLIPVSGGKDSTWQVITALEYGLKPLCVTWKTPARSPLGQLNLDNLISLGVDHLDISINPDVERKFTLKSFERFGSPVIPMHMAIHALPMKVAIEKKIPLILWGENSATEYGGDESLKGYSITEEWLKRYSVTFGTRAEDWVDEDLSVRDLNIYSWPAADALEKADIKAVFLGEYFKWDPRKTASVAKSHGFKEASAPVIGQFNFADVDDLFLMSIHHWVKWYKFGFTRSWDNLSSDIRNGSITREGALKVIKAGGVETPHEEISSFCDYVQISIAQFYEIAEKFRDTDIWFHNGVNWEIKDFLIHDMEWVTNENSQ